MALCLAGCGFYGSEAFAGMCSMCFKKQSTSARAENAAAPTEQSFQLNVRHLPTDENDDVDADTGLDEAVDEYDPHINLGDDIDCNIDLSGLLQRLGTEDMSSFVGFERAIDFDDNTMDGEYRDEVSNAGPGYNQTEKEAIEEESIDDVYSGIPLNIKTHSIMDAVSSASTTQLTEATEIIQTEKSEQRTLCRADCGFYSNLGLDGLCSVCFKKLMLNTSSNSVPTAEHKLKPELSAPKGSTTTATVASAAACPAPQPEQASDGKVKRKKNRCITCRKNVGLLGFACRCEGLFCGEHRYSDKHGCTFDYKAQGKEDLTKQMMTGGVSRKFNVGDL